MIDDSNEKVRRANELLKLIAAAENKQSFINELLLKAQQLGEKEESKEKEKASFEGFDSPQAAAVFEVLDETVVNLQIVRRVVYKMMQ